MSKDEISRSRRRGLSAERELAQKLWKMGFAVVRGPASGARIKRGAYPDLVAIKDSKVFVFEVKKRKELETLYIDRNQLEKLLEFARRAGGEPLLAVKVGTPGCWKAVNVHELLRKAQEGIKVRVDRSIIEDAAELFTYLNAKLSKPLDTFARRELAGGEPSTS